MESAGCEFECLIVRGETTGREHRTVPVEAPLTLSVNGQPWVTLMCTPVARRQLALGFAYFAGLFRELEEVLLLEQCLDDPNQIRLRLKREDVALPSHALVTSGCGQGIAFPDSLPKERVGFAPCISPERLWELMRALQQGSELHRTVGGTHASALSDGNDLLAIYEDIGRHNTVDKLMGHALLTALDTRGTILLTSGRVSSEMMYKAARMQVSLVVSRTVPTDVALGMARQQGIGVVGYVRGRQMTAYCGELAAEWGVPA